MRFDIMKKKPIVFYIQISVMLKVLILVGLRSVEFYIPNIMIKTLFKDYMTDLGFQKGEIGKHIFN